MRDVGRAMGVPLDEVDVIAKMIPGISGKPVTINGRADRRCTSSTRPTCGRCTTATERCVSC